MVEHDLGQLLFNLIAASHPDEYLKLLTDLGDSTELDLGEPIGKSGLVWHPVGGDPSNLSAINLATKPGRSLTERITNAEDALLELMAHHATGPLPKNPREAAASWFGRPVTGPDTGLFNWNYHEGQHDKHIWVVLLNSGRQEAPTIDVLDAGIGLRCAEMPGTLLNLRGGNKIKKFYLMGAFGQGGSSTLAFSDYALYASRHVDEPERVAFTVVRVRRLGDTYKEDCYAYLAHVDDDGRVSVPSVSVGSDDIVLYPESSAKPPSWRHGTLIRHVGFKLPGLDSTLQASPGNLYHFLHASLFDPLLPFRLLDLRRPGKEKNELVSGSRNRLMRYTEKKQEQPDQDEDGPGELKQYSRMEYIVPHGETTPSIGIEYWVVLNWRKAKGKERILRPSSNELFVQRHYPVIGTLNGQNQGELPATMFRKLNLGMVGRHIVVNIDASLAPSHVRRELFSSTREGFKEGPVLTAIERVLTEMLAEDQELVRIERELAERVVQKENAKTEDEVKKQITKLLMDSGVSVSSPGLTSTPGSGNTDVTGKKKRPLYKKKDPLPTLPYPQVTRWEMVVPHEEMTVHLGDYEPVLVETDADAEYDKLGRVAIRAEPPVLEVGSKLPLRGGRVRWRMRTMEIAKEGQEGHIIASLTRPDGSQLVQTRPFKVKAKRPEPAKKSKGLIPPFEVLPIDPTNPDDQELWGQLWPELAYEEDREKLASVAYKTDQLSEKRVVYFNTLFGPFRSQEDLYLQQSKGLAEMYRVQYKIWIGYHALLQDADSVDEKAEAGEQMELIDRTLTEETIRVATMQAKQAKQFVEVKRLAIKEPEPEAEPVG